MTGDKKPGTHTGQESMTAVLWFRNDLRLDDHEALCDLLVRHDAEVIPVYCIDARMFEPTELGFRKTGAYRAQFLIDALKDLRQSLQELGSDLVLLRGRPEVEVPRFAQRVGASEVGFFEEVTSEEMAVESALRQACQRQQIRATGYWGSTLYHVGDLPFYLEDLPDVFTQFRKKMESQPSIRAPMDRPSHMAPLPDWLDVGEMVGLEEFGFDEGASRVDARAAFQGVGGEQAALARVQEYFFELDTLRNYKQTRNGLIGANYSSKLSPWLALGNISPRRVFTEVKRYERERVSNRSTYWLVFELTWRDYFRFLAMSEGTKLFKLGGVKCTDYVWRRDQEVFSRWVNGMTGIPFIDANMRELACTGFMSNRGRQNVASYLAKSQCIDWRWGASYFESMLVDYDPCSNWGNWQYVSGVGNDPRDRRFNVVGQGERYDEEGKYIKMWVPELGGLPRDAIHAPWRYGESELQRRFGVVLGEDYPQPLEGPETKGAQQLRLA